MTVLQIRLGVIEKKAAQFILLLAAAIILTACAPQPVRHAPIVERGTEMKKPAAPAPVVQQSVVQPPQVKKPVETQNYVVQKGDTMYSIAFMHGVDYRELAELNKIENPGEIKIGQQLRIPVSTPTKVVESKPQVVRPTTPLGAIKTQPKVGRIPYSETALAQAEAIQEDGAQKEIAPVAPVVADAPGVPSVKAEDEEEDLEWGMPTIGRVIALFSENANRKGVDIAGRRGQPVVASAAGKVVYSGSGLRGYGKLVIIKHNKTFLSAYAHNDQILVKEGQSVSKGQKIAEMGETDSDQVKLHFEIRKFGKPVDPGQYLPLIKP
jgi:lipoprotein NlpD